MDCSTEPGHAEHSSDSEQFRQFAAESRQLFQQLEELASSWGVDCGILEFSDVGLYPGNASGLYLSEGSAAEFGLERPAALISIESVCREQLSGYWRDLLVSIVCHEWSHHVVDQFGRQLGRPAITVPREIMTAALTLDFEEVTAAYRKHNVPPWSNHGILFIRSAAHISWRMAAAGFWAPSHWTIPPVYSLSSASWYFSTLEGEPERLAHLPVSEILGRPVPVGMVSLFADDVARWARSQERQQQQQAQPATTPETLRRGSLRTDSDSDDFSEEPPSTGLMT